MERAETSFVLSISVKEAKKTIHSITWTWPWKELAETLEKVFSAFYGIPYEPELPRIEDYPPEGSKQGR